MTAADAEEDETDPSDDAGSPPESDGPVEPARDAGEGATADGREPVGTGSTGSPAGADPDEGGDGATATRGERVEVDALTGPMRTLDPRVRIVWLVGALGAAAVLGGMATVGGVVLDRGPLPGAGVFLFVALLGGFHALLRYRVWRFQVRDDSLYLERGVLTRTKTVVPYVRIQHVDASRSPVERAVGLATSVVYTAGSRGADVTIPGLTPEGAEELQDRLKGLAIAAEGEDAV